MLPRIPELLELPARYSDDIPHSSSTITIRTIILFVRAVGKSAFILLLVSILSGINLFFLFPAFVAIHLIRYGFFHHMEQVENEKLGKLWEPYFHQVEHLVDLRTEQAQETWLVVLQWTITGNTVELIILNGDKKKHAKFPIRCVERRYSSHQAVRFPKAYYMYSLDDPSNKAKLFLGPRAYLADPSFVNETPQFGPEIDKAIQMLVVQKMLSENEPKDSTPIKIEPSTRT